MDDNREVFSGDGDDADASSVGLPSFPASQITPLIRTDDEGRQLVKALSPERWLSEADVKGSENWLQTTALKG